MFFLYVNFRIFGMYCFFFFAFFEYCFFFLENWTGILAKTNLVFEDSGVNVQTFQRDRGKTSETPEKSKLIEHNIKGGGIVSDKWGRMATDVPCLEVTFSENIPILQTCATFNLKKFDCAMAIW